MTPVPAATRVNLQGFFEELTDFVVLRNHDIWSNLARGGDVDLLVADASEAEEALFLHLGVPLWLARRPGIRTYGYPWGHLDVLSSLERHGVVYLPERAALKMAERSHTEFPRPRLAHEALVSWLGVLLVHGRFKERY